MSSTDENSEPLLKKDGNDDNQTCCCKLYNLECDPLGVAYTDSQMTASPLPGSS
jgi:hypothetical protein